MKFQTLKQVLNESKVFNVLADDLLDINLAAEKQGASAEVRTTLKKIFKELHSASPDLTSIHAEIEELKKRFGINEPETETNAENKTLGVPAVKLSTKEINDLDRLLDLNIKLSKSGMQQDKKNEVRNALKELKAKIDSISTEEFEKALSAIDAQF